MKKRHFETYQKRFRDFEILPKFSETHLFRGTIRQTLTGNVEFPKFQTGMFVEWKAPQMYINLLCIIFSDNHYSAPSCDHFGRHGG